MIPPLDVGFGSTGNQDFELLEQNIKKFTKALEDNPTLDGLLIENISLAAGDNTINHRLGRALRGWYVTRFWNPTGAPMPHAHPAPPAPVLEMFPYLYDKQDTNGNADKTLILTAAAACKVSLWVF